MLLAAVFTSLHASLFRLYVLKYLQRDAKLRARLNQFRDVRMRQMSMQPELCLDEDPLDPTGPPRQAYAKSVKQLQDITRLDNPADKVYFFDAHTPHTRKKKKRICIVHTYSRTHAHAH